MVRGYERREVVPLKEVLAAIPDKTLLSFNGCIYHTDGNRLLTYHIYGVNCCVPDCPISGLFFAVEKAINQKTASWHLNLYGKYEGKEVMLTSDHRIPKSRGGLNHISNRQPMCYPHNMRKGNQLIYTGEDGNVPTMSY